VKKEKEKNKNTHTRHVTHKHNSRLQGILAICCSQFIGEYYNAIKTP